MGKGILFVISGPSGVGKGTVLKELMGKVPDVVYSVSATTRPPRQGEKDGKDYFFLSAEEFKKGIAENKWLEWARVHNSYYGTPRLFVEQKLHEGHNVILEIDTQGARQVKERCPDAVFIFLTPPSVEDLTKRLEKRGTDSLQDKKIRLRNAIAEMEDAEWYDYCVVNDSVQRAAQEIKEIMDREKGGI